MNRITTSLALSLLALGGCIDGDDPPGPSETPPTTASYSTEVEIDGEMRATPIATLKLEGGATAAFYVWPDLSAGYLLSGSDGAPMPADGTLDDLSAAEVFYAMSRGTAEIPTALLQHHDAIAADGTRPAFRDAIGAITRGWYLDAPQLQALAECNNGTFVANNCDPTGFAGVSCPTDTNGDYSVIAWGTTAKTRKFSGAFCIDAGGTTEDYLRYEGYCGGTAAYIWGDYFPSQWWGSFTWIAPSGAQPRHWYHKGYGHGYFRDWASRWGAQSSCL